MNRKTEESGWLEEWNGLGKIKVTEFSSYPMKDPHWSGMSCHNSHSPDPQKCESHKWCFLEGSCSAAKCYWTGTAAEHTGHKNFAAGCEGDWKEDCSEYRESDSHLIFDHCRICGDDWMGRGDRWIDLGDIELRGAFCHERKCYRLDLDGCRCKKKKSCPTKAEHTRIGCTNFWDLQRETFKKGMLDAYWKLKKENKHKAFYNIFATFKRLGITIEESSTTICDEWPHLKWMLEQHRWNPLMKWQ